MVDRGRGEMKPTAGRLASNCTALHCTALHCTSTRSYFVIFWIGLISAVCISAVCINKLNALVTLVFVFLRRMDGFSNVIA